MFKQLYTAYKDSNGKSLFFVSCLFIYSFIYCLLFSNLYYLFIHNFFIIYSIFFVCFFFWGGGFQKPNRHIIICQIRALMLLLPSSWFRPDYDTFTRYLSNDRGMQFTAFTKPTIQRKSAYIFKCWQLHGQAGLSIGWTGYKCYRRYCFNPTAPPCDDCLVKCEVVDLLWKTNSRSVNVWFERRPLWECYPEAERHKRVIQHAPVTLLCAQGTEDCRGVIAEDNSRFFF